MSNIHPSPEAARALVQLCDALCTWERATGQTSVVIVRGPGYVFRALDGKPIREDGPDDTTLLRCVE